MPRSGSFRILFRILKSSDICPDGSHAVTFWFSSTDHVGPFDFLGTVVHFCPDRDQDPLQMSGVLVKSLGL